MSQKKRQRVLFVCTANALRSRTAEEIFKNRNNLEVKSAGTHNIADVKVTKELIHWADRIFVMELHHKKHLLRLDPESKYKIIVLNIPDIYDFMDPQLIEILQDKVPHFLEK